LETLKATTDKKANGKHTKNLVEGKQQTQAESRSEQQQQPAAEAWVSYVLLSTALFS